ncbi:MAG: transporter substrate-binding domain-containing protein [Tuberibacillus sp.]
MKKSFKLLAMIGVFCLVFVLGACGNTNGNKEKEASSGWDKIKEKGVLTVGTSGTLYASSFHKEGSNELTGYDVEVAKEVAKRLGLKVKFQEMGIDAMLPSLQSGKIDIAANDIGVTKERKKNFTFSDPYKYSYGVAIVRKKDHSGIEKLEDLKGKRAGGEASTIYSQIAKKYGAEIVTYGNATNDVYLKDVALGRTDVILNDYYLCKMGLSAYPNLPLMIHPDIKYNLSYSAIAMDKDNTELNKQVNKALDEMKKDGTLAKLAKEFYGADVSKKPNIKIKKVNLD